MHINSEEFGRVSVGTVPLPDDVHEASATYTYSGRVLVLHRLGFPQEDRYALSVVADDGSGFRTIFEGVIPERPKANGIRHMPFADNKRVLLGDYVLECTPDIDTCTQATLVEVTYPWGLDEDPLTSHRWSEIIVSPDNEHVAWTILRTDMGAAAAWGCLRREDDRYVIGNPVLISSVAPFVADPDHEGHIFPVAARGGEVKQFVCGGTAISAVGSAGGFLPDSVMQSLTTDEVMPITRRRGYDETTMFSPDEQLGLVMTSRASTPTDPEIFGLVPRPFAGIAGRGMSWAIYLYTVAGVRSFRDGNIGPVLIDIERSAVESGYFGLALNEPGGEWVYCSPLSWHPSGRRAMWMETLRGSDRTGVYREMRIRVAHLHDYVPAASVSVRRAPTAIPYGITGKAAEDALRRSDESLRSGPIAGRHSGRVDIECHSGDTLSGRPATTTVSYHNFSDDGRVFYDGTESTTSSFASGTVYRADLVVTGDESGEMRLRATFSAVADGTRLLFDADTDGLPKSHGFARYGSTIKRIEDLVA